MRVLYVAPRYHTNQIPIMKGWIENGHQVMFISQFQAAVEDYSILEPIILGYSKALEPFLKVFLRLRYGKSYTEEKEYALRIKIGIPPIGEMKKHMERFGPEVVIVRERSLYNIPFYLYCKKRKISCILYNQSPVWDVPERDSGLAHRLLLYFLPKYRMTPVMGTEDVQKVQMENTSYIPFVIEPHVKPEDKKSFQDGKIQLLCVGRYEERKNLFMLVDVINELKQNKEIFLTIIGEVVDEYQKKYYKKLVDRVKEYGLENQIFLLKNLNQEEIYQKYAEADLFVLPSTRERASVSQLEAMSCSVPVICSDTNGTACYVKNGVNGYLFRDMDEKDLKEKIEWMISDKEKLRQMGANSYKEVIENYQFVNYYKGIKGIVNVDV